MLLDKPFESNSTPLVLICNQHHFARDFQSQTTSKVDRKLGLPLCPQGQGGFLACFLHDD